LRRFRITGEGFEAHSAERGRGGCQGLRRGYLKRFAFHARASIRRRHGNLTVGNIRPKRR
jgi:hypothetical protein